MKIIKNIIALLIAVSCVIPIYALAFSLNKLSVFQNILIVLILIISFLFGAACEVKFSVWFDKHIK